MIVVTTPMCKKIVEWAGLQDFKVNKHPDEEEGDLAILLSESKVSMNSLAIKINTFSQIKESIKTVSECLFENGLIDSPVSDETIASIFKDYRKIDGDIKYAVLEEGEFDEMRVSNSKKKVKVYSEFLKEILRDIGACVIDFKFDEESNDLKLDFDYVVYPDYLEDIVLERDDLDSPDVKFIKILSHNNISKDPILKAESRYSLLIEELKD